MHKVAVLRYMPHEVRTLLRYSIAKAIHEYKTATSEKEKINRKNVEKRNVVNYKTYMRVCLIP